VGNIGFPDVAGRGGVEEPEAVEEGAGGRLYLVGSRSEEVGCESLEAVDVTTTKRTRILDKPIRHEPPHALWSPTDVILREMRVDYLLGHFGSPFFALEMMEWFWSPLID
jgi:hypothetical protein